MQVIGLKNVRKEIEGHLLFSLTDLVANHGDRIGLIGSNGSGKSTLLQMIAGEDKAYLGNIRVYTDFAYVRQVKAISQQSGGEQMMAELREALARKPSLLILDEPTANLDTDHREWLINQLQQYDGSLLMVSHDRYVLNQCVQKLWAIEAGKIREFIGDYTAYQADRRQQLMRQEIAYDNYQRKVKQLEKEANRRMTQAQTFKKRKKNVSPSDYKVRSRMGRYDGQEKALAKSSKHLEKRLSQMESVQAPKQSPHLVFKAHTAHRKKGESLINLRSVDVRAGNKFLFNLGSFKLVRGDKISLKGPNQAGKTTFLNALYQQELAGYYAPDLRIGYFRQNFVDLQAEETVYQAVRQDSLESEALIRTVLASLGFGPDRLPQEVRSLSGGEKVRLSLAKILLGDYDCLLLDEPTNYLDLTTLEKVEEFLRAYPGTFILVSHDQDFANATCEQELFIQNQQLLTKTQSQSYDDQLEKEISLLEMQLDVAIMDSERSLEEIKEMQTRLRLLKDQGQ